MYNIVYLQSSPHTQSIPPITYSLPTFSTPQLQQACRILDVESQDITPLDGRPVDCACALGPLFVSVNRNIQEAYFCEFDYESHSRTKSSKSRTSKTGSRKSSKTKSKSKSSSKRNRKRHHSTDSDEFSGSGDFGLDYSSESWENSKTGSRGTSPEEEAVVGTVR